MGLQVPHSVDTEVSKEKTVCGAAARVGSGIARAGKPQRERDIGRALAGGPCAHADLNTTEVCGVTSGRVYQG